MTVVLLSACSSTVKTLDYSKAPEWVQNHPLSQSDYIGVGISKKVKGLDFRDLAKKNAYEEISSEISVSVSSNSILNQQEKNGKFTEMFKTTSKTFTNNQLTGCKQIAHWENKDEYWVYYKLSKAEVERQKQLAIEDALISLEQAIIYDENNDYPNAISAYAMAISAIKPYLGQRLKTEYKGRTVFLGQLIIDKYRSLISSVVLTHNQEDLKFVSFQFIPEIEISLTRNGQPLKNIPLKIESKAFKYEGNFKFNSEGKVTLPKVRANTFKSSARTTLSMDVDEMIDETVSDDLVKALLKGYKTSFLELKYILDEEANKNTNSEKQLKKYDVKRKEIGYNTELKTIQSHPENSDKEEVKKEKLVVKIEKELNRTIENIENATNSNQTVEEIPIQNENCLIASKAKESQVLNLVKTETFENNKLSVAKSSLKNSRKCFSNSAIKQITEQFTFEQTKLSFLKYAYAFAYDKNNYYTLSILLTYTASRKELTNYINR